MSTPMIMLCLLKAHAAVFLKAASVFIFHQTENRSECYGVGSTILIELK